MSFKFNPFTATFDIVNPNNYSYNYVSAGLTLTIRMYQQMVVRGRLTLVGRIKIEGYSKNKTDPGETRYYQISIINIPGYLILR